LNKRFHSRKKRLNMGGCISEQDPEMREGIDKNKKLDVWLRHNNQDYKTEVKLLLLGSGDSGKSTFFETN